PHDSTNLRACGANDGFRTLPSMDTRDLTGFLALFNQRNETRLGIRLAFIDGRGNLRDDPDRFRPGTFIALRPRIERAGPGDRNYVGHRRYRFVGRQNLVLAVGTVSPSEMGHRENLI